MPCEGTAPRWRVGAAGSQWWHSPGPLGKPSSRRGADAQTEGFRTRFAADVVLGHFCRFLGGLQLPTFVTDINYIIILSVLSIILSGGNCTCSLNDVCALYTQVQLYIVLHTTPAMWAWAHLHTFINRHMCVYTERNTPNPHTHTRTRVRVRTYTQNFLDK